MKKHYRYILYFLIGFTIYFIVGADDDPTVLKELHEIAPALIIGIVILMIIVRFIISKQKNNDQDEK